jgi:hypothetical protein
MIPTALSIIHLRACLRRGAGAIAGQLTGLMGNAGADLVQTALQSALGKSSGIPPFVVGAAALLITASGVFGEMLSLRSWPTVCRSRYSVACMRWHQD